QRAVDTLRSLPSPQLGAHGVYIEVGNMADKTQRGGAVIPVMRQTVLTSLQKRAPAYQVRWPSGRSPTEADLKRVGATAFFVDASLTRADAAGSRVACGVSMTLATYPGKSMFGFLNGPAEVDAGSSSQRAVSDALGDCVPRSSRTS